MDNTLDSLRDAIKDNAAWDKFGIEVIKEEVKPEVKPGKKAPIKESKGKGKEAEVNEDLVCPLCESHLKEELTEKRIVKHVNKILDVFEEVEQELNEGTEDTEDLDEEDLEDVDDEDEDEYEDEDEDEDEDEEDEDE